MKQSKAQFACVSRVQQGMNKFLTGAPAWTKRCSIGMALGITPLLAHAQANLTEDTVTLYGMVSVGVGSYTANGATAGNAANVHTIYREYDSNSHIGLRGNEYLGNGMSAIFQIEGGLNANNGSNIGPNGKVNASTDGPGSRTAFVGLASKDLGQIRFGRQNVFWNSTYISYSGSQWFSGGIGVQAGGIGRGMAIGVSRVNDTIQYLSPKFFGVIQAIVSYSSANRQTLTTGYTSNGDLYGLTLEGQAGAWSYGWDTVRNESNTLSSPTATMSVGTQGVSTGSKVRLRYDYSSSGNVYAYALYSHIQNGGAGLAPTSTADAAAHSLRQFAFMGGVSQYFGSHYQLVGEYFRVNHVMGCVTAGACNDTGAQGFLLGARYFFSKHTRVYLAWQKMYNDRNYNMDWSSNSQTPIANLANGADPMMVNFGIQHDF